MKIAYGVDSGFLNFPGKFSVTIYLSGCNLHCDYCYNKKVVNGKPIIDMEDILRYLDKLKNSFVDNDFYVVLSGGEPTANKNFKDIVRKLKSEGYKLGLHTNGLIIPRIENVFDAVILSVKYPEDGVPSDPNLYTSMIAKALRYYYNCKYSEFRMVKIKGKEDWIETMKNNLLVYTPAWKFRLVDEFKPNK